MESHTKNLAPNWWDQGKCLITGGISSQYLNTRQTAIKSKKSKFTKSNWGKNEETNV